MRRPLIIVLLAASIGALGCLLPMSEMLRAQLQRLGLTATLSSTTVWLLWTTGWWRGLRMIAALRDQRRRASGRL
ncbi:MAG: hypothetical protein CMN72_09885 [Sphingomonas sp.]|nr:hypothetical protein [Sphingomonas sp.]